MHVWSRIPMVHDWPQLLLRKNSMNLATLSNLGDRMDSLKIPTLSADRVLAQDKLRIHLYALIGHPTVGPATPNTSRRHKDIPEHQFAPPKLFRILRTLSQHFGILRSLFPLSLDPRIPCQTSPCAPVPRQAQLRYMCAGILAPWEAMRRLAKVS
jgi:hypothetical protein